jgi:hypothetical protein
MHVGAVGTIEQGVNASGMYGVRLDDFPRHRAECLELFMAPLFGEGDSQ